MNYTCLKPVFDDMILLRSNMGVEIRERKEEVGHRKLAWSTAPPRIRDNMVLSVFRVGLVPPSRHVDQRERIFGRYYSPLLTNLSS